MSDPITASNPIVLPAVPERVYDRWLIQEVLITGTGLPGDPVSGQARFRPYRRTAEGEMEQAPPEYESILVEPDIHALAAGDPEYAAALEAFRAAVVRRARQKGLL